MSIRLGIVGAGTIGGVHATAANATGIDVVCVADADAKAAKALAEKHGIPAAVDDPKKLFASDQVDAVVIGVPNKFHKPLAIAAMEAGKDVLLEKPMALTAAECRQINTVAARTKRILQMGFMNRYAPSSTAAKSLVDAGRLGKIYHIKANYYRRRGIPGMGGWFTTKSLSGGGPLIDLGVHVIDLAMYLAGYPKPLRASGKVYANFGKKMKKYLYESMWAGPPRFGGKCDVEDSAHALIRLDGGVTFEMNTTWAGNFPDDSVNDLIGLEQFSGNFSLPYIPVDTSNPLMATPNDMGSQLFDDSSPGQSPYGLQPNGRLLYTVAWHGADFNTPGISSTIEGSVGFQVEIGSPVDGTVVFDSTPITFQSEFTGGGEPDRG